jgi:hypothetical protein
VAFSLGALTFLKTKQELFLVRGRDCFEKLLFGQLKGQRIYNLIFSK